MFAIIFVSLFFTSVLSQDPIHISYGSDSSYGPDGPWQAVRVQVGGQSISLYPGAGVTTRVLSSAVCESSCLASLAGTYNRSQSTSAEDPFDLPPGHQDQNPLNGYSQPRRMNLTGSSDMITDTVEIAASGDGRSFAVDNVAITVINESRVVMPDGNSYDTQVGFLGMGWWTHTWVYTGVESNFTTGALASASIIPSYSFGLHVGSVLHGQPGSLVLGGYDMSRVIGPVGTWSIPSRGYLYIPIVPLVDISLGVETGQSPFENETTGNFLATERPSGLDMAVDPTIPYIHLPFGVCENIASYLPVTWLPGPGLYRWNTDSPSFDRIMNSAAHLAFTFEVSASQNITIKLPFQLLNLTLESPIVNEPVAYLPCKPSPSSGGQDGNRGFLGRAFLQAAYFVIQWDGPSFSLAQAPGPDSNEDNPVPLQDETDLLVPDNNMDFARSWSQCWTATDSNNNPPPTNDPEQPSAANPHRLSGLGIAGIATGSFVALTAAAAALWCFVIRPRIAAAEAAAKAKELSEARMHAGGYGAKSQELEGAEHVVLIAGRGSHRVHELAVG